MILILLKPLHPILLLQQTLFYFTDIDVINITNGLHSFHIRFKPDGGLWSSISSSFFYKSSVVATNGNAKYQYWFDNKVQDSVTVNISSTTNFNLLTDINTGNLSKGLHVLNIRFKPDGGLWSVVKSDFFIKQPVTTIVQNSITKFQYWFDNNNGRIRELQVGQPGSISDLILNIDADGLSLGKHYIYGNFVDATGIESSVVLDSFIKTTTTIRLYVYPKIDINTSTINAGNNLGVTGIDFTARGIVDVRLLNNASQQLTDTLVYADSVGKFNINYIKTNVASGEYLLTAFDRTTFFTTNPRRLKITNSSISSSKGLYVTGPKAQSNLRAGQSIIISWNDFGDGNISPTGKSAKANVLYKLEKKYNNGTWQAIGIVTKQLLLQRNNALNVQYDLGNEGDYRFRVSRVNEPARVDSSANIYARLLTIGFDVSYEWDSSGIRMPSGPIGLCAEGTARFYLKISKSNTNSRNITSVSCTLKDGSITEPRLLGKLQLANTIKGYSIEANNANQTQVQRSSQNSDGNYWFWYVAPDDFARDVPDNTLTERIVEAIFIVNYSNGTADTLPKDIKIIRPPLVFVHGINSDPSTWYNLAFSIGGLDFKFINLNDYIYKFRVQTLQMDKGGSFLSNAQALLNLSNDGQPRSSRIAPLTNSIQYCISEYRSNNFACNRVDYVGHSMGGCIARTAINELQKYYNPAPNENVRDKNYGRGFINKLITVNTPYNGTPFADLATDNVNNILLNSVLKGLNFTDYTRDAISGLFDFNNNVFPPSINPTQAVQNLRSGIGGVKFKKTFVRNHLIGGDVAMSTTDCNSKIKEITKHDESTTIKRFTQTKAIFDAYKLYNDLNKIGIKAVQNFAIEYGLLKFDGYIWKENLVNGLCLGIDVMMEKYGYPDFVNSSDIVVPLSSQLPGVNLNAPLPSYVTLIHGKESMHTFVTGNIQVGNEVFDLINRPINSPSFADSIPANPNLSNGIVYRLNDQTTDSIISRIDTFKLKIMLPVNNSIFNSDSSIKVVLKIKDTSGLIKIEGGLLDEIFISYSKAFDQTFVIPLNKQISGNLKLYAKASFDSSGFIVHHMDTVIVKIPSDNLFTRLYTEPSAIDISTKKTFIPNFYGVMNSKYALIPIKDSSLSIEVADTNVVTFSRNSWQFVAKDSGTTYAIISYNNVHDTAYFFVSVPLQNGYKVCPGSGTINLNSNSNLPGDSYQWQADTSGEFINIINDSIYSGANSNTLQLSNAPTFWYGNKYRCKITNSNITSYSNVFILVFTSTWTGSIDNHWENISNWSCGTLPDENTDVIINSGAPNYPVVNTNTSCRSLILNPSAIVTVTTGHTLSIKGK